MSGSYLAWISFASLGMLGWAAAAIIPILIHLLRQRRKTQIPWASMELLNQVVLNERQRASARQLLLLALRVLILLLLSLALARPFFEGFIAARNLGEFEPNRLRIFILDTSYSMSYRRGQQTRFDRARQRAAEIIGQCPIGDAFALIAMDQPSRAIIGQPTLDAPSVLREIQNLTFNARGCDPLSALSQAERIVAQSRADAALPQQSEIVVLTDLGEDAWRTATAGPLANALKRLSQQAEIRLEPIVDSDIANAAIEGVRLSEDRPRAGKSFAVDVSVACYGHSIEQLPVQLLWNDRILASAAVDLSADERKTVTLRAMIPSAGIGVLTCSLPSDNLLLDNRFDLALEVRDGYRVLIVSRGPKSRNPWFLALSSGGEEAWMNGSVDLHTATVWEWQSAAEWDWDAMILDDLPLESAAQLQRLARYVRSGGCLVVALGKNLAKDRSPVSMVASDLADARERLFGFRLLDPSDVADWRIDPLGYASPSVKIFEGYPNAGLLTTPVFRFWRMAPSDPKLRVELAVDSGGPILVSRPLDLGSVTAFLTAPEDGRSEAGNGQASWNAMTTWPSFLPLAQQVLQLLLESSPVPFNRQAGEPLRGFLPADHQRPSMTLKLPNGLEKQIQAEEVEVDGRRPWVYDATDQQGVYRLIDAKSRPQIFAVNIDPIQSSLRSVDPAQIDLGHRPPPTNPQSSAREPQPVGDWIPRIILWVLGALLIAESFIARAFGRRLA